MLKENHRSIALAAAAVAVHHPITHDYLSIASSHTETVLPDPFRAYFVCFAMFYGVWVGSTLPDIDQNVKGLRHRGITHSLFFVGLIGFITHLIWQYGLGIQKVFPNVYNYHKIVAIMFAGITFGVFMHILCDYFSVQGIDPFYPIFGYKDYPKVDEKGRKYTVSVSRFPRIPLYHTDQKFFGMGSEVWTIIMWVTVAFTVISWNTVLHKM